MVGSPQEAEGDHVVKEQDRGYQTTAEQLDREMMRNYLRGLLGREPTAADMKQHGSELGKLLRMLSSQSLNGRGWKP